MSAWISAFHAGMTSFRFLLELAMPFLRRVSTEITPKLKLPGSPIKVFSISAGLLLGEKVLISEFAPWIGERAVAQSQ